LREKAKSHHEQKFGNSGEASPRGFGTRGDGGAQERRTLQREHDRMRGQLELSTREHHLHCKGFFSSPIFLLCQKWFNLGLDLL